MKLRNKINLSTVVLFICLLIVMNLSVYHLFSSLILNSESDLAKSEAMRIATGLNESIGVVPPEDLLRAYVPIDGMIRIVKEDGTGLSPVTSPSEKELVKEDYQFYNEERNDRIDYGNQTYSFNSTPIIWSDGQVANLQLTKSLHTAIENLRILRIVLMTVTIIAMIPVIISSRLLSNLITRPITNMIETMSEIQKSGQFKHIRLEGKSKDELTDMGHTFNRMIDLLASNFKKQEDFVSNASHELKTPLTVIESYASLLKRRGKNDPDLFDESIESIHSEAIRMREMTEQLLLLAKHNEEMNINMTTIDAVELVKQSIQSFQKAYNREIVLENTSTINVQTDAEKLRQLLFIILDNARKYSDAVITVNIGNTSQEAYIRITDRGIGIPQEDLTKVFDRFFRVDQARSRKQGGTGLGLALAKEIADAIGVRLKIDSLEGVGTTVTINID